MRRSALVVWTLLIAVACDGGGSAQDTPDTQVGLDTNGAETLDTSTGADVGVGDDSDGTSADGSTESDLADAADASDAEVVDTDADDSEDDSDVSEVGTEVDAPAPWVAPDDPFEWGVVPVELDLEPLAQALLEGAPSSSVTASVRLADGPPLAVRVTMVGDNAGGFAGKPALVLRFVEGEDEVAQHGTDGLVLGPMTEDPSQMRERLVHLIHRLAGVPAPRSTHARLTVHGEDFGLYAMSEPITSPTFQGLLGGDAGAVFISRDRVDLWPWQVADYLQVTGDEAAREGLDDLATALETFRLARLDGNPVPLVEAVGAQVDLWGFVDQMALHIWIGHWAGYARSASGFGLMVGPADGDLPRRVTFLPMALGRSLEGGDAPNPWIGGGKLVGQCRDDAECRRELGAALRRVTEVARVKRFDEVASALRFIIASEVASDPRRVESQAQVRAAQDELLWELSARAAWVEANLGCAEPQGVDADGDGSSPCEDDCDDDRADVYPGAPEQCNLRDDDCDGILDDDVACEPCVEVDSPRDGVRWHLCFRPRTWVEAQAQCQERGGELASITSEDEALAFQRATLGLQWTTWWLGLSDRETEGEFVWADAEPVTFAPWSEGEPNDSGGREDCAQVVPWNGRWNDLDCARTLPFVCQVR